MDKTTAGGLGVGWLLIAIAIILGGVGFGPYVDVPSIVIVFGGTIAVTAGQFEAADLKRVGPSIKSDIIAHFPSTIVTPVTFGIAIPVSSTLA